ncbi:MAG: hypothetical protein HJJLKODD_01025 [Phycisphaerae bacterium]|nr:hypothetical protein [Phycisphaerae bacterium]
MWPMMVIPLGGRPDYPEVPAVRPAAFAGSWYPDTRAELITELQSRLECGSAPAPALRPRALIVPHAGYRYSANVAAAAYRSLRKQDYQRVIILAPSHHFPLSGVAVLKEWRAYATPLGEVKVDQAAVERLLRNRLFTSPTGLDREEHALELQLPFLQQVLGDFQLVPVYVGRLSGAEYTTAARELLTLTDAATLFVISSDFTHYGKNFSYQPFLERVPHRLSELAEQALQPLLTADFDGFSEHLEATGDTICGQAPIKLLLRLLALTGGAVGERCAVDTSGQQTGDWSHSVTYQSIYYHDRPARFSSVDRVQLLQLARKALFQQLHQETITTPDPELLSPTVRQSGGCFVTLRRGGELRGCIGVMEAVEPLYRAVIHSAVSAAQDSRFTDQPVSAAELDQLHLEISCLSPHQPLTDYRGVVVGRDGLLIERGRNRGVLLPQVAYERGWSRQQFLEETCRKAGLPSSTWRDPHAKLYTFQAEIFDEHTPPA